MTRPLVTLENGMRILFEAPHAPIVTAQLLVEHGAAAERAGEEGLAHFLEHVIVNGESTGYTRDAVSHLHSWLGYVNAHTTLRFTNYSCRTLPQDFPAWVDWISAAVSTPTFDNITIERERQRVLREISDRLGKPDQTDEDAFSHALYRAAHPHARIIGGLPAIVEHASADSLRAFFARGYTPRNMILAVGGRLDSDLTQHLYQRMGRIPSEHLTSNASATPFEHVSPLDGQHILHVKADDLVYADDPRKSNAFVKIGFLGPLRSETDAGAAKVLDGLLGGVARARLYRRVSRDAGLAYRISSSWYGLNNNPRWTVQANLSSSHAQRGLDMIFEEFAKLREEPVDQEELNAVKHLIEFQILSKLEEPRGQVDAALEHILHGYSINEFMGKIKDTNAADVQNAAHKYLPTSRDNGNYVLLIRDPLKQE